MRLAVVALPLVAVAAACSSFSGDTPADTPAAATPTNDAGNGVLDASNDATLPDADAGSDAARDPCSVASVYCSDFPPGTSSLVGLTPYGVAGGTTSFDSNGSGTDTGQVKLILPLNATQEVFYYGNASAPSPKTPSDLTFALEINLDGCPAPSPTVFFAGLYDISTAAGLRLYRQADNTIGVDNAGSSQSPQLTVFKGAPTTGWLHITMQPEPSTDMERITISPVAGGTNFTTTVTRPTMQSPSYFIGPFIQNGDLGTDGCTVAVDSMRISQP